MDNVITGSYNSVLKPVSSYIPNLVKISQPVIPSTTSKSIGTSDGWSITGIITIILIIVLLAVLGLNVFSYLAEGTDYLGWIVQKFSSKLPEKGKDLIDTTITGLDLGADVAAGAVKDAGDVLSREFMGYARRRD